MSSSRRGKVSSTSSASWICVGDRLGCCASPDGQSNQFAEVGVVEVVGWTKVCCAVGVEHDHVTRVQVPCLGRELRRVEHPEEGPRTADRVRR